MEKLKVCCFCGELGISLLLSISPTIKFPAGLGLTGEMTSI